ncbi:type VII secretion target [Lentzea chajnantorensis]
MSDGYVTDVAAVRAAATRLDGTAAEVEAVTTALGQGSGGDLGPGVTAAADELLRSWADRTAALRTELAEAADELRAAGAAYRDADELHHG